MSATILIHVKELNPRILYTFGVIFKNLMGFGQLSYTMSLEEFSSCKGIKISYLDKSSEAYPFIFSSSSLLYSKGIDHIKPDNFSLAFKYPCFYAHKDKKSLLPFDFPAMVFWLITRYEEYLPYESDKHGRFPATESYAFKHNFLELPLINLWTLELQKQLKIFFPTETLPKSRQYSFTPTYDIDYAWAYKNKSVFRQTAAGFRDIIKGNFNEFIGRLAVLTGKNEDPYFTFSFMEELHSRQKLSPIFFWLVGDYGEFDKNSNYRNENFRKLIKNISSRYNYGIHPSYASNKDKKMLKEEIRRLAEICGTAVKRSRQHFLKLKFPETYQKLISEAIEHDYTMGYAELPGFRASIACSYKWYDLINEKETMLLVHPFMVMDVTLNVYMKLSVEEALQKLSEITQISREVGGELISIWHNSSFSEKNNWKDWRLVYSKFYESAIK